MPDDVKIPTLEYLLMKMKISVSNVLITSITFLIGVFFLISGWHGYQEYAGMKAYTSIATGKVIDKRFSLAADDNKLYVIDYRFMVPSGKEISNSHAVSQQQWKSITVGDLLQIRYNPFKPDYNVPLNETNYSVVLILFVFLVGIVFIVFSLMRLINFLMRKG